MMRSNTNESDEAMGVDSEDSNVGSSKTGDNKQPPMKGSSDTSNEANDPSSHAASYPSSTSATVATKARRQPTAQSLILPSHKTVAATAAPAIPRSKKKSQSAGFREQFLPKVRIVRICNTCLPQFNSNVFFVSKRHTTYSTTAQNNAR